ncbi:hypothetical protein K0M31_007838 [Melipona bicolor]|uniref:Uncharacterized protein n=1 Tax=Melipona bicolor TaxID=60889 RepID=A0AA40GC46_9HYME|nr:hypothetical protein K0M31_007838 [Melipona bicolor]
MEFHQTPIASEKARMALLFHSPGENGESQKRGSSDARAESGEGLGSRIFWVKRKSSSL